MWKSSEGEQERTGAGAREIGDGTRGGREPFFLARAGLGQNGKSPARAGPARGLKNVRLASHISSRACL